METKYEIIHDETTKPELRGWYVSEDINGSLAMYGPYATEAAAEAKLVELKSE